MELHALKRLVVQFSRRLWEQGYVANHDGNISVRLDRGRLLATPTAMSKVDITENDLLVVDLATGKVLTGTRKVFSEISLHQEFYRVRPDVNAVVHAHPPVSFAMGCVGLEVDPRITPEAVVSLGDRVPLAPVVLPGSVESKQQVRSLGELYDVIALGNHGLLACGADLEQAYLRLELVEHLAKVHQAAQTFGGLRLIPGRFVGDLLDRRKKAGLGPEARGLPRAELEKLSSLPVEQVLSALAERLK